MRFHLDLVGSQAFIPFACLCPICWTLVGFVLWNSVYVVYYGVVKLCAICYVCSSLVMILLLFYIIIVCYIYAYWIPCAHVNHVIKSRGSSLSRCVLYIQMQISNRAHG
jgi:hypothetical protein